LMHCQKHHIEFHQNFEIDYPLIPDILGIMPFRKYYYNFDLL
jgi:hypothetical protein